MSNIETYPPRYYQYLATQQRVSDWVKQSGSVENQSTSQVRRLGSKRKRTSESTTDTALPDSTSVYRHSSKRHRIKQPGRYSESRDDKTAISPAIALVSSSIFVWALLPSILTLSAFVIVLGFASLNDEVSQEHRDEQLAAKEVRQEQQ